MLDVEHEILYEIVRLTINGERIWNQKLLRNLRGRETSEGKIDGRLLFHTILDMHERGIIHEYTGETKRGYAGFLWRLNQNLLVKAVSDYNEYLRAIGAPELNVSQLSKGAIKKIVKRRKEYELSVIMLRRLKERSKNQGSTPFCESQE
jgi:hypothetical protein